VSRRDPLLVTGVVILLLFLMLVAVLGRMFLFLRFISLLLLVAILIFAGIVGYRFYYKGNRS
jgi:energy-coupling factor transporter transmembrane protein EcfT